MRVTLTNAGKRLGSVLIMSRESNQYDDHHAQALVAELVAIALARAELAA